MRVLLVGHVREGSEGGGVGRHLEALAAALASASHEVSIFTRVSEPRFPDLCWFEESPGRFRWNHLGKAGTSFRARTVFPPAEVAFRHVVDRVQPDLIAFHHLSWLSVGLVGIAASCGVRTVITLHDFISDCPRGQRYRPDDVACVEVDRARCATCVTPRFVEGFRGENRIQSALSMLLPSTDTKLFSERDAHWTATLAAADAIVVPSESTRRLLEATFPVAMARARVLPPFVEVVGEPPPQRLRGTASEYAVGYFGSVIPSKGVDIAAMAAVRSAGRVRLHVFGGDVNEFQAGISLRAGNAVVWHGKFDEGMLPHLMSELDAVVIPSRWPETFNIVLRETVILGRAVIASRVGALVEAIDRGWAVGVEPGDPNALLQACLDVIESGPPSVSLRGEAMNEFAESRQNHLRLYEQVASSGMTVA